MRKKIIFITIIIFIIIITIIKLGWRKPKPVLISPLPENLPQAAEEATSKSISYYITTSQEFLNKARELAEETSKGVEVNQVNQGKGEKPPASQLTDAPRQQTPEEKQRIIGLINQALDLANQAIAAYPRDDRGFAQRATIYQALTPFLPQAANFAIQDLKEAIKLNNQNPTYQNRLANLYIKIGDFEGAALAFYNAHLLAPTELQTLYNLADALEKSGQLTKAKFYFEKLLNLLPATDENQPVVKKRLENLEEAIVRVNLQYLTPPGETAPAASSKDSEIIGTQELPLEQAALAKKLIIATENETREEEIGSEVAVNAKTGEGTILAGQKETIIYNNNVANDKQIVIVPTGKTENRVVYLVAKKAAEENKQGWFKVGIDKPATNEIKFRWWIVD